MHHKVHRSFYCLPTSLSSTSSIRPFLTTFLHLLSTVLTIYPNLFLKITLWGGCCSFAQSCPTLCNPMDCSTPGFPVLLHFPELAQTHVNESVMPSNHLILCRPLLLLLSIFPSIRVFSNELALRIRWPKYWSFSINPSNEYSVLISFRIDWFDLAVQGTLKSLLQYHSSKASILRHSAFFMALLNIFILLTRKLRHREVK